MNTLRYKLNSGKPNKFLYFVACFAGLLIPNAFYRRRLQKELAAVRLRPDYDYIRQRVDYYIKLNEPFTISEEDKLVKVLGWVFYRGRLCDYKRNIFHTAYFFDQHEITRWFPKTFRWNYCPGDVYFTPNAPTIVKSRLLKEDNQNSVLLKLDKLRHFMFVKDRKSFEDKHDRVIFRGKIRSSRLRVAFLERYFGNPLCDCGVIGREECFPEKWLVGKKTIKEHLDYKFIMAIEGNDVASNLKWVMSSNSIAVMPRPTCETWFMEGTLIPDYHYIEVKDDFSDLPEKLRYYAEHIAEAKEIIRNAHEYVEQFRDKKRERLIALMVMERYFRLSGQMNNDH